MQKSKKYTLRLQQNLWNKIEQGSKNNGLTKKEYIVAAIQSQGIQKSGNNEEANKAVLDKLDCLNNSVDSLIGKLASIDSFSPETENEEKVRRNKIKSVILSIRLTDRELLNDTLKIRDLIIEKDLSLKEFLFSSSDRPLTDLDFVISDMMENDYLYFNSEGEIVWKK